MEERGRECCLLWSTVYVLAQLNRRWSVWCLPSPVTLFLSLDLVPDGVVDMQGLLMEVVQNSSHGWDYVLEGIVQFGFSLMEGYSPRSVTSAVPFGDLGCIDRLVCDTGAAVILRTYEVRAMVAMATSCSAVPCPYLHYVHCTHSHD